MIAHLKVKFQSAVPQHGPPTQVTALHLAAFYSSPAVVKALVKAGADANASNDFGHTGQLTLLV